MENKEIESEDEKMSNSSSTVEYLKKKFNQSSFRKASAPEDNDRANFCLNLMKNSYTVIRSYISTWGVLTRLYYTKFTPKQKIAQVCIIHGYGESSDDYLSMGETLAKRGNVVHMVDMRGFGYSGGSRVNEPIESIFADIQTLLNNCCERDLPTFIIAQGLGAIFVQCLLQQNLSLPLSGVVLISPLLSFRQFNKNSSLQKIIYYISPWIVGNILVHNMINPTAICKNPHTIKNKIQNVFFQSFITLSMVNEYQKICSKVRSQAYKFTYPVFFCYGLKDFMQNPKILEQHFLNLNSTDKTQQVFAEGYHELHKDNQANQLVIKIYKWLQSRKVQVKWKRTIFQRQFMKGNIWRNIFLLITILIIGIKIVRKLKF